MAASTVMKVADELADPKEVGKIHKKKSKKKKMLMPTYDSESEDADVPDACKAPSLVELDKISTHLSNGSFGGMTVNSVEAEIVDGRIEVVAFQTDGWNQRLATLLGDAIRECLPDSVDFEVWGTRSS